MFLSLSTPGYTTSAPNGASMRPNTTSMRSITERFYGSPAVVFSVASGNSRSFPTGLCARRLSAGTPLPEELILVHEFKDHWSLQPAKTMSLDGGPVQNFGLHVPRSRLSSQT